MSDHENKMRELEKECLIQDCIKIRLTTRPWMNQSDSMLNLLITMGKNIQGNKFFPKELSAANQKTIIELERELTYRQ